MNIEKNHVVSINYKLKDSHGNVLDSSDGGEPLTYLHGSGQILLALESALEGKKIGEKVEVTLSPEQGYGVRDEKLQSAVPIQNFPEPSDVVVGAQFRVDGEQGPTVVTVIEVKDDKVVIDGNHPLAGITLNFAVEVVELRAATPGELQHGHAHGPGGHDH